MYQADESLIEYISTRKWVWAKTYAKFAPHWWYVDDKDPRFKKLVSLIFTDGIIEKANGYTQRYLHLGSYRYWVMDKLEKDVTLINRTLLDTDKLKEVQMNYLSVGKK